MTIKTLQIIDQRIRRLFMLDLLAIFLSCQPGHAHFIGNNLNRHRQVQRTVFRVRGNRDMIMAFLQLFIGQANTLTTKNQRHRGICRFSDAFQTAFARVEHRPRQRAGTCAGAHHQATTSQRFVERIDDVSITNHIAGPCCQGNRLGVRFHQWINQPQIG